MEFKGYKGKWYIENDYIAIDGKYPSKELNLGMEDSHESMITIWCANNIPTDEELATSQLIISALDLLENLEMLVNRCELEGMNNKIIDRSKLAITKAFG